MHVGSIPLVWAYNPFLEDRFEVTCLVFVVSFACRECNSAKTPGTPSGNKAVNFA
jgi:hypothetical protein